MTKETYSTILLSECPVEHKKCKVRYYRGKGRILEMCMCRCHEHARPSIRDNGPEPILGIYALRDIH